VRAKRGEREERGKKEGQSKVKLTKCTGCFGPVLRSRKLLLMVSPGLSKI
jgi:hypothetical protein